MIHLLGKKPPRLDPRTLRLARYLPNLPPTPAAVDWSAHVTQPWGMMLNDSLGDCTCAALGHAIQTWTAALGAEITPPDAAILAAYEAACGYNPADPSSDQGGCEIDVLNYFRATGVGGHKIAAYVALNPQDQGHVRSAVQLFGGCYIGVALPLSAQDQDVWDVVAGPQGEAGSWGGHAVYVVGYNETGPVCITWGALKQMTWAFWAAYCDESYAVLSPDWVTPARPAPGGFNYAALQADLAAVAA